MVQEKIDFFLKGTDRIHVFKFVYLRTVTHACKTMLFNMGAWYWSSEYLFCLWKKEIKQHSLKYGNVNFRQRLKLDKRFSYG